MKSLQPVPRPPQWLHLAAEPEVAPASAPNPPVQKPATEAPLDDDALIDAVRSGDTRRASELHDRLISVIERTLYRIFGRRERDHEDLVQATFEQIVLTLMRKRFAHACSLSTWASTVAAHVAFKALRSRRRERGVFDSAPMADVAYGRASGRDAEREIGAREQIQIAQSHLAAIHPDRAMALVLHDIFGHELAEIAVMLNISVSAAQSRLLRGRREFLQRMQEHGSPKDEDERVR